MIIVAILLEQLEAQFLYKKHLSSFATLAHIMTPYISDPSLKSI